ncbi:DUF2164 family protein [Thalassotalea mangrovi]|nr:DUF2164 family protein [Thalassotalea mangrovi]
MWLRKIFAMSKIEFTNQEKESMVEKLQSYFEHELHQDLGQFDAGFRSI